MDRAAFITPHLFPDAGRNVEHAASASPGVEQAELDLVARARSDPLAFGILYRRHHRIIWAYLVRRTGRAADADDLVADVFLLALERIHRFQPRGVPFVHWLYGIATRLANRHIERASRRGSVPPRECSEPSDKLARDESWWRVRAALDSLPADRQAVVVLHYLEGLTHRQIALALGVREGTIRSRLARGVRGLRAALRSEEDQR